MMTKDEIFLRVKEIMIDTFEIDAAAIGPEATLQELDFDSIDAVDLIVKLQQYTKRKVEPESFKQVRTIQDIVDAIHQVMLQEAILEQ